MLNRFLKEWRKKYAKVKVNILIIKKRFQEAKRLTDVMLETWADDKDILSFSQDVYRNVQDWKMYFNIYQRAIELYPNNLEIKINYGTALFEFNKFEEAISQFNYCLEHWDYGGNYLSALANLKARLVICYEHLDLTESTEKLLEEINPSAAPDLDIFRSYLLHYANTAPQKIPVFLNEQTRLFPNTYALYYWQGLYFQYYIHDFQSALTLYCKALDNINPSAIRKIGHKNYLTHINPEEISRQAAALFAKSGNVSAAKKLPYQMKLKFLFNNFNLQIEKYYVDFFRKDLFKVEYKVQKNIKKKMSPSQTVEYYMLLANIQFEKNDLESCTNSISRILVFDSEFVDARKLLGRLQLKKKDWHACVDTYQHLTKIKRFDTQNWINLGYAHINLGNTDLAVSSYKQALELNPFEANTWVDLGMLYINLGDKVSALEALGIGLQYNWLDPDRRRIADDAISKIK